MNLNELKLQSFRNYREIAAQFDPGVNLIVGDNAQGKTNLLEGIYLNAMARSFETTRDKDLIRFEKLYIYSSWN